MAFRQLPVKYPQLPALLIGQIETLILGIGLALLKLTCHGIPPKTSRRPVSSQRPTSLTARVPIQSVELIRMSETIGLVMAKGTDSHC